MARPSQGGGGAGGVSPAAGTVATAVDDDDDEEEADGAVAAAFGPEDASRANSPPELPVVAPPLLPFDAPLPDLADGLAPTA